MSSLVKRRSFSDFFPTPQFLTLTTAGIAITDRDTKLIELKREFFGSGFKLGHATKMINPKGAVENGLIQKPDELAEILKKLDPSQHLHFVNAVLPEEKSYLFTAVIDKVPQAGLRDAIAFIVEDNVPISLAESIFDFEVIREIPESNQLKVTVVVMPKVIVESYTQVFEKAELEPVSFVSESQAIAKAVIHHGDKRCFLIINLSLNKTGFYIVEDEVVQFSTTLGFGIEDVTNPNIADLKAEIRKILAFWSGQADKSHQSNIEKILLTGFGAGQNDLIDKFMSETEVEHSAADVWVNTSPERDWVSDIPPEECLECAAAIGLVLPLHRHTYV